ncbi:ribonuclease-like [Terrapene carolina triunguis]|uniref:ribonuclease-like n=1 Tax=Terrapene triunguis TaxID=2587831 RepID=UPI000CEF7568|nr:ribonuclease-like [Terrapene carolina triunguis]
MALRGPSPTFLLTLALLAACVALTLGQRWNLLNDIFRKDHVDYPKTRAINNNAYCNKMMWDRVMYLRYTNTFIHATAKDINKVCTTAGLSAGPYRHMSTSFFSITTCTLNPWSISYTGISANQKIVISCLNRLPVFYVKST